VIARRLVTVPVYLLLTALVSAALPVLVLVAALASLLPGLSGSLPTLLFVAGYLWCETIGIACAAWLWLRHRSGRRFLDANYRLQCWWANALKTIAEKLYRLSFEVQGREALRGPPALVLPRHASIADTVIPMVFYAIPSGWRLRYVLKRELLLDPCLDIVGNRLPNYFVDRGGQDSERARRGVAAMVADLGPQEGALIYPEGTRFSVAKRDALARRYADQPDMLTQLERWPGLLPPRLGGTLAMLEANPGRDLLFCAHAGFEGSSHFRNLVNGSWIGSHIRILFWRVPFEALPVDRPSRVTFLFAQWDQMQRTVDALR
jgi:1-acyl-sn-glycerol-3-phosphate acyltransferase